MICPGFASDCVETLEEIQIQGKKSFLEKGGKNFEMVPCLNDSQEHIDLLLKKGVFPYDYMTDWNVFEETKLPPKKAFCDCILCFSV